MPKSKFQETELTPMGGPMHAPKDVKTKKDGSLSLAAVLKANPYHDERGRFSDKNAAKFVSITGVFAGKGKAKGSKRKGVLGALDELSEVGALVENNGTTRLHRHYADDGSPTVLKTLAKSRGFDKKPKLVSKKELDDMVAAGGREVFRGDSTPEYRDAFHHGDLRYGLGIYGNGMYMASYATRNADAEGAEAYNDKQRQTAINTARSYAGLKDGRLGDPKLVRGVIPATAKVLDYDAALKLHNAARLAASVDLVDIDTEEKALTSKYGVGSPEHLKWAEKAGPRYEAAGKKFDAFTAAFDDVGHWAMAEGYDALHVKQNSYVVLLNRSILVLEE